MYFFLSEVFSSTIKRNAKTKHTQKDCQCASTHDPLLGKYYKLSSKVKMRNIGKPKSMYSNKITKTLRNIPKQFLVQVQSAC